MVPGTFRKKPKVNRCLVCKDGRCGQIDDALSASRANVSALARQFGFPLHQMKRHRDNCLPLRRPKEEAPALPAAPVPNTIEGQAAALFAKAQSILNHAEVSGKAVDVRGALRECRNTLELIAKLKGQIDQNASIAVFTGPVWLSVQSRIIDALEPHPLARAAVVRALQAPIAS